MEQSDLPHDLITQNILTRLPVETLIRFKTVSKQWKSTLCSPEYARAHLSFPRPSSSEVSLLIRSNDKFTILSYEDGSECEMKLQKMEVDFGVWCDQLSLVGTCNGLVCLGSISGSFFIIWNPITREFCQYPGIDINYYDYFWWIVTWGFGYVSAVDDYKIIRICKKKLDDSIMVNVFSLKSDKWRRIDNNSYHNFSDLRTTEQLHRPGVLVNEILYWMPSLSVIPLKRKILYFDLALELFDTFSHLDVSTPSSWIGDECFDEFMCVVKGCLSKYGRLFKPGEGVVTILKGPGETEQILLPADSITDSTRRYVIGFPRSDKFFIQYGSELEPLLGMVDPCSWPVKHTPLMTLERMSRIEIACYSATLISPASVTGTCNA